MPSNPLADAIIARMSSNSMDKEDMGEAQGSGNGSPPTPGSAPDASPVTIPNTLAAALLMVNKHLAAVIDGKEQLDEDEIAPQIQTMMSFLQELSPGQEAPTPQEMPNG